MQPTAAAGLAPPGATARWAGRKRRVPAAGRRRRLPPWVPRHRRPTPRSSPRAPLAARRQEAGWSGPARRGRLP